MSGSHVKDQGPLDCKVYVGGLGEEASRHDLWDTFEKYGKLKNVWVARNPPGFAFIEYEDHNDAADAVEQLDQRTVCNRRVKVELSTGESRRRDGGGRDGGGRDGGGRDGGGRGGFRGRTDQRCYECGRPGHLARDCRSRGGAGGSSGGFGGGGGGRYSSSGRGGGSRRYSRSRSRSNERRKSPSRSRSRSPVRRSRSRSRSPSRT